MHLLPIGYDPTFDKIDIFLLTELVQQRIDELNETSEPETPESRIADQQELDDLLIDHFEGNSFLTLYIHSNLVQLAEKHFQDDNSESAITLYDYSLIYLNDVESSVTNTLHRLSYIKLHSLTDQTDMLEEINTLHDSKNTLIRFFDFFPSSTSHLAQGIYLKSAFNYFAHFPQLLQYDLYHQDIYDSALSMITAAKTMDDSTLNAIRLDRLSAWELSNATISIQTPTGTPITGDITITNVSDTSRYIYEPLQDVRTFSATSAITQTPIYLGHAYNVTIKADVQGGNQLSWTINDMPHAKGKKITYDHGTGPTITDLLDPNAPAEIVFISSQPTAPYNLIADKFIDTFTLLWDWIPPVGFNLKEFKVFRSGTAIGTVTSEKMVGIPLEIDNNSYSYAVIAYDTNDTPSDTSASITVTPDFTDEQQAYFDWIQEHFGNNSVYDFEDNDNDGVANYYEYLLGSDPNLAPVLNVKPTITDAVSGLFTEYYQVDSSIYWLPDFDSLTPLSSEIVTDFNFTANSGNILGSNLADYVALRMKGYIDIPADGKYRFYLNSDNGSKLYINEALLINNDGRHSAREYTGDIYMRAGVHSIEIQYYEYTGSGTLEIDWKSEAFQRRALDSTLLWYTPNITPLLSESLIMNLDSDKDGVVDMLEYQRETDINNNDSDFDGLSDYEEIFIHGTDPLLTDTDNDGQSDFEEVMLAYTDPLVADFSANDRENILIMDGIDYIYFLGNWRNYFTSALCSGQRGSIEYLVDLPEDNSFRLQINISEHLPVDFNSNFDLKVYIDDELITRQNIICKVGENSDLILFTPYIDAGDHIIKIFWDGHFSGSNLKINSLTFQRIGGSDINNNDIADWIDNRLSKICSIDGDEVLISKTSPACIEGKSRYVSMMWLSDNIIPKKSINNRWYADIPLNSDISTTQEVLFQNAAKLDSIEIMWEETNLLIENTPIIIRKGDSLLMTAHPDDVSTGTYSIDFNGVNYSDEVTSPSSILFDTAGTFTLVGTYTADNESQETKELTITVIEYSFPENSSICWKDRYRIWETPKVPEESIIIPDTQIEEFSLINEQSENSTKFSMILNSNDNKNVIARLESTGSIINSTTIDGIDVFSSNTTYVRLVDTYEDGSKVFEMLIILTPMKSDIRVNLKIFIAGILFDDGSIEKNLTIDDFDELGQKKVYFVYPPSATSSVCHTLKVYQNDVYLGSRY